MPAAERLVAVEVPLDVGRTLSIHRRGTSDPTMRFDLDGAVWRAARQASGPATVQLVPLRDAVRVRAWGPGAAEAAARVERLLGLDDPAESLVPRHAPLAEAARRLRGLRFGRTDAVLEALVPAILEQKVTGEEARTAFRRLVRTYGEPAPGPIPLRLPVAPEVLARLPYHAFHAHGVERRRAELIARVAAEAARLESLVALADAGLAAEAYARLTAYPGIGPWTAAEVGARAFGDADAVSVGDYHLPHLVTWAFAGEPRGTDERMLELLEPYAGHRGRVTRLLELAGPRTPRRGPRLAPRRLERI